MELGAHSLMSSENYSQKLNPLDATRLTSLPRSYMSILYGNPQEHAASTSEKCYFLIRSMNNCLMLCWLLLTYNHPSIYLAISHTKTGEIRSQLSIRYLVVSRNLEEKRTSEAHNNVTSSLRPLPVRKRYTRYRSDNDRMAVLPLSYKAFHAVRLIR